MNFVFQGVNFVKTHGKTATVAMGHQLGKQATAAVNQIQSKIRENRTSPRSSQPSTPSFADALSSDNVGQSTALPDFSDGMERTTSGGSTRASEPLSPTEQPLPMPMPTSQNQSPSKGGGGAADPYGDGGGEGGGVRGAEPLAGTPTVSANAGVHSSSHRDLSPGTAAVAAEYVHVAAPLPSQPDSSAAPPIAPTQQSKVRDHAAHTEPSTQHGSAAGFVPPTPRERKGVFLRIQASDVKVVGEKGTKVPNFTVKELAVLLECTMEAAFEWTELEGWQPMHKLKLNIETLEHSISGTNIPVPKTLLKYLLNLLLPALIEARLLAVLPAEVGQYFIDSETPGVQLGGKLHVFGPSLSTLNVDLATNPNAPPPPGAPTTLPYPPCWL